MIRRRGKFGENSQNRDDQFHLRKPAGNGQLLSHAPSDLFSSEDMLHKWDLLLEELSEQDEIGKMYLGKDHRICSH
jgi:hypothetical protein